MGKQTDLGEFVEGCDNLRKFFDKVAEGHRTLNVALISRTDNGDIIPTRNYEDFSLVSYKVFIGLNPDIFQGVHPYGSDILYSVEGIDNVFR